MKVILTILTACFLFSCVDKESNTSSSESTTNESKIIPTDILSPKKYSSTQLDNTKGLSNSSVNAIFKDSENFIWIGTWDGLNRYNGYNFKTFRPVLDDDTSINNQVVLKIDEDKEGKIWVLTMNGINCYDKKKDEFQHFYFNKKYIALSSEYEFNMALNNSKNVFCAVKDWGIGFYNGTEFISIKNEGLPTKTVKKMEFAGDNKLILLFEDGELYVAHLNKENKIVNHNLLSSKTKDFGVFSNNKICTIDSNGITKIISIDEKKEIAELKNKFTKIIGKTDEGLILSGISTTLIINENAETSAPNWFEYLKGQKTNIVIKGSENMIWAGTDGEGVFKIYPEKKLFNIISKEQIPSFDGGIVRCFLEIEGKQFLVGTKGKGLFSLRDNFYISDNFSIASVYNDSNSSINNSVYALCKGNEDLVFIGTDAEGISVLDLKSSKIISWSSIESSIKYPYFKSVYSIFMDNNGFLWIGTNGYGLVRCKIFKRNGKIEVADFKQYLASNTNNSLGSNIVFAIIPKDNQQLWIGTRLGGLNLFDIKTEKFIVFKNQKGNKESISSNDVLSLHLDLENRLWIGTSYGLNLLTHLDDEQAKFKTFTITEGLPNNTVHGIVSDLDNNLWVSTNMGISNYNLKSMKFVNYTKEEGLQNNEFSDGACYRNPNSEYIFMGGIKGFNYYLPQKISESKEIPNLLIDKISGQNQAIPYLQGIIISPNSTNISSITLEHNQNFFDIELTALTYANSDKCKYAYQLRNFDMDWNSINSRRIISFTNVPHGNYSLWLKWSNSDGVWSKPVHAIDIEIKPIIWLSPLAKTFYVLLSIGLLLFIISYYNKRESLKRNILFRKKEEEIHENRLSFFTDVAHEFQTPLTLIIGPIQKLIEITNLDANSSKYLKMIQSNSSRLFFLTQQLLEFRKAEHDYLEVSATKFDMVSLAEQIAELFDEWALEKKINYSLEVPSSLVGWFDKDKVEKIIFNLMSNAFKYTPVGGKIVLRLKIKKTNTQQLCITVINTGKGISKEKLESIFERFFITDVQKNTENNLFRTGIGLAYVKKMVTVMRGEIQVSSIADVNTTIDVFLPCGKENFEPRELNKVMSTVVISDYLENILEKNFSNTETLPHKLHDIEKVTEERKIILLVEDEKEIHNFVDNILKDKYKLISVYNGQEALEYLKEELPDIIISDIMMPVMDGLRLCKKIKENIETCHIPVIMLTAKDSIDNKIEGIESGANSYISKPFYPEHLLVRIQKLLDEKEKLIKHFEKDNFSKDIRVNNSSIEQKLFIRKLIEFIKDNVENETLNQSLIEDKFGMSNSQLYRKTKEVFGYTISDLIRTIRLKHAAELLRKNEFTVSEICYKSGFNNRSYFYREFNKIYNTTPKNYQLKYKSKSN